MRCFGRVVSSLLALLAVVGTLFAQAQGPEPSAGSRVAVPRLVRFSGLVHDAAGRPARGAQDVTFSLYAIESGGEPLWFETQTVEADAQGRYSVLLGAMHPDGLPVDLFTSGEARWLGVSVGKLPEQSRVLLVAVPYALKASDADTLGGKPATAFVATDQLKDQVQSVVQAQAAQPAAGQTTRTLVGTAPTPQALGEGQSSFSCNLSADCVAVTQTGSGIGLHATAGSNVAIFGETASTTGRGVYGLASAATGATIGVWGGSYSTSGVGMSGRVTSTTGATKGMYGVSFSTSGIGVHGDAPATSGSTRGVWGSTASTGGIAVWGQASAASGTTYGTLGTVASTSGIGASGQANAVSGLTIGVLAKVLSASGTAIVANNTAGGKIFSGQNNGVEIVSIGGAGNIAGPKADFTASGGVIPLTVTQTGNQYSLVAQSQGGSACAAGVFQAGTPTGSIGCGGIYAENTNGQAGVYGRSTGGNGIFGVTNSSSSGVYGSSTPTSGAGIGVSGYSAGDTGKGVYAYATSTTGLTTGLYALADSSSGTAVAAFAPATTGTTYGVSAHVAGDAGTGVYAHSTSATGSTYGAHAIVDSTGGTAIWGEATAATGTTAGVIGYAASSSGNAIMGLNGSGPYTPALKAGVYGESTLANGNGVIGVANNGAAAYGVWGKSSTGFAGVFAGNVSIEGNLSITGNLSKGTGTFKIDHPLDPQNKYLSHSFVESPEMKDMYDGVARLDSKGRAWVTLPAWFEALNGKFRYQLTAVGASQPGLYIAHEVSGNRFEIAGGKAGARVSWMVTGVRHDAYAKTHPTAVEEEKSLSERGYYLHPEAFGLPESKGVAWAQEQKHLLALREGASKSAPAAKVGGK